MNLSASQQRAMLELGGTTSDDLLIPIDVLQELLSLGLVYWRTSDFLDFTPTGEGVYKELVVNPAARVVSLSSLDAAYLD